jgi:hypothetical protein
MLKRIAAVSVLAALLGTGAAVARDHQRERHHEEFGAIAYSRATGHYGYSSQEASRADAEDVALNHCEGRDCRIKIWFKNSCAALATSQDGKYTGWAHDLDLDEAKERAVEECRNVGGRRCRVLVSACTR